MSPVLIPAYAEDLDYDSYRDRFILGSLAQPGVTGIYAGKVEAGSGLQVNVNPGYAFVKQGPGGVEIGNENRLYNVPIEAVTTPYNSAEVSAANPQVAQIILRVYDVSELKIVGSSYARLEWLNGTPSASATKAKMEEGKYEGAKELPSASLRLAYVLVPKNATKSSEYYIEDSRNICTVGPWERLTSFNSTKFEESSLLRVRSESGGASARIKGRLTSKESVAATAEIATVPATLKPFHNNFRGSIKNEGALKAFGVEISTAGVITTRETITGAGVEVWLDGITYDLF